MEVIWVLENVIKSQNFYNQSRILLLVSSVSLWRKYHPDHKTVFYCDEETYNELNKLGILSLFHEVRNLSYPENIDRVVFWSSCKTKIISETKIPLCIVDHDFLIFTNIDQHLKDNVLYTYDESDKNWYPPKEDKYLDQLTTPIEREYSLAANVSLFYLPDPKFANEYGKQVLKNHIELTKMKVDNSKYMIASEQLMLKQWLNLKNIKHKTLHKNIFDNDKLLYQNITHMYGIWGIKEAPSRYKHYGILESVMDHKEREFLVRCINAGKLIDGKKLKQKLDNEGYPC